MSYTIITGNLYHARIKDFLLCDKKIANHIEINTKHTHCSLNVFYSAQ